MNKRGAIMHWILFGVLLALGIFFVGSKTGFVSAQPKAQWQLGFLQHNYLEAEKDILRTNIIARKIGSDTALTLADNGGFTISKSSECGNVAGVNLWNSKDKICFPDALATAIELTTASLSAQFPGKKFSSVGFKDKFMYGSSGKESIATPDARYTFENSFYVNIRYSFDEYKQIEQEAQSLLALCTENIAACIKDKKPKHWHYLSCQNEPVIPVDATELVFCVESPGKYKIDNKAVEYVFGLDFA